MHRAGLVLPNFHCVHDAVRELLGALDDYRANVARIQNRAVFEIPDMLAQLIGVH